ncbi:hypothetical protein PMAYCL1PPCAC_20286, partial [Pristionchus mayeri]
HSSPQSHHAHEFIATAKALDFLCDNHRHACASIYIFVGDHNLFSTTVSSLLLNAFIAYLKSMSSSKCD